MQETEEYDMLPTDPFMLLSVLNTKLRDEYSSLKEMCDDLELDEEDLCSRLKAVGFEYDPGRNQFR